jgi:Virulence protein
MGLTTWKGTKPRKQDVTIATNYLNEEELSALNNLVEQYLVFAEGQAMRRIPMHMQDWVSKLDGFLSLNDREVLSHAGKVSHELAKQLAEAEYDRFHQQRLDADAESDGAFEKAIAAIEHREAGKQDE